MDLRSYCLFQMTVLDLLARLKLKILQRREEEKMGVVLEVVTIE